MIALLTGILRQIDPQTLILDVNGVGYQVAVTTRTQSLLGPINTPTTLQIVTQVREDAITLFGFATRDEKESFLKLTTVQGVGAKMALSLLSTLTSEQLWRAIIGDDKKLLTSADGVGPKLAARLTTELQDFASKQIFPGVTAPKMAKTSKTTAQTAEQSTLQEAVSALVNLGYTPSDAARAVSQVANENQDADLQTLIRLGLREVAHA
jgi:Holliday junction DNA helicase RuvA